MTHVFGALKSSLTRTMLRFNMILFRQLWTVRTNVVAGLSALTKDSNSKSWASWVRWNAMQPREDQSILPSLPVPSVRYGFHVSFSPNPVTIFRSGVMGETGSPLGSALAEAIATQYRQSTKNTNSSGPTDCPPSPGPERCKI